MGWTKLSELKLLYLTYRPNKSFRGFIDFYMQGLANDLYPNGHDLLHKNRVVRTYYKNN